jgi:hypothetical protein
MEQTGRRIGFGQRWRESRPTKISVVWACVGSIVATMIVGFTWGGWVTGGTALRMADGLSESAVVRRLAPICVVRFKEDVKKDQKLKGLKETGSYEQADYVKKQGCATMPGEPEPDAKVADECVKLLISMN